MLDKKIIIFMPSIEGGGVERNLFEICNFLSKKFQKVRIITVSRQYKKKFTKNISFVGPKRKNFLNFSRFIKYIICSFYLCIELLIKKKNKAIIFSFQGNIFAIIIGKLFGYKVIVRANSAPSGWINNGIKKEFFKRIYKLADLVIVNSVEFQRQFKNFFNTNAVCIYNPLNKKKIIKLSNKKTNFFNQKKNLKVLNIGRLVDQKNQIILLKALDLIKNKINFRAIIMGNGVMKNKLKKFIVNKKLGKNVKIIKYQKNPYNILKSCDVLIHTAKYEGLPNVLVEAQLLKRGIISSDCPTGPKEILIDGKAGILFKNNNHKELYKKIIHFYKHKNKLNKKIQYGYKQLYRFDYDYCLNQYYLNINKV